METPIEVRLLAEPRDLGMAERARFHVGVAITNRGSTTVDPQAWRAELHVDGERAPAWDLAIGNGTRPREWEALPPGETVQMAWPLGEALFEAPGEHTLVLRLGDRESTTTVHVRP